MLTGFIIVISGLVQLISVFFALRLIRVTGGIIAWIFISSAIGLMGVRRMFSLAEVAFNNPSYHPNLSYELLGLLTSLLMLLGIVLISPLFKTIRQSKEALRDSEQRLFKFLEKLPVGVFIISADGKPFYANKLARDMLGKGIFPNVKKEQLSEVYEAYIEGTDELYPAEKMPIIQALSGVSSRISDMEIRKPEGNIFLDVFGTPIYDENKVLKFAVTAFANITDRKRGEQEREQLITELQKALAEIKTLRGILPICCSCKKIRDDKGLWTQMEAYVREHTEADFTHGYCPECAKKALEEAHLFLNESQQE
ncbi:MAG TPA: hypothetical protein DCP92_01425 [Nitrospiraceae bacterium]|jgi:PAS domain-containing protein|nr:hypothetical protein [Nitrospiraceae bacterium]